MVDNRNNIPHSSTLLRSLAEEEAHLPQALGKSVLARHDGVRREQDNRNLQLRAAVVVSFR